MRTFTKIITGIAAFCFAASLICLLVAWNLGFSWTGFKEMVGEGSFSIGNHHFYLWEFKDKDSFEIEGGSGESGTESYEEDIKKLEVEFSAGVLTIQYGDVDSIQISKNNIRHYSNKIKGDTMHIEGGIGNSIGAGTIGGDVYLTITIPKDMKLEEIDLEIGASEATLTDLNADKIYITVGAGEAKVHGAKAGLLDIEVGLGQATFTEVDAKKLDMEVGMGELNIKLLGAKESYSYNVNCGIGEVTIDGQSCGGLGASSSVNPPEATHHIDAECGIGEITIEFQD